MHAYVLINTKPGKAKEVADALSKIDGVKDACAVTGPYDVASLIDTHASSFNFFLIKVKGIDGVEKVTTLVGRVGSRA